jgi:predicted nucleotidyltransferase
MEREFDKQEIEKVKEYIRNKEADQASKWKELHSRAASDAASIIEMIIMEYNPLRIYQWGSIIYPENFRNYSDIDIGVEGIEGSKDFFDLLGKAQSITSFPVDIVQIEKIEPEYAEDIRENGRLVYERK